jgi:hypothetical protein
MLIHSHVYTFFGSAGMLLQALAGIGAQARGDPIKSKSRALLCSPFEPVDDVVEPIHEEKGRQRQRAGRWSTYVNLVTMSLS